MRRQNININSYYFVSTKAEGEKMAEATVDIERSPTGESLLPQVRLTQLPDLLMFYFKLDRGWGEGKN